MLAYSANYYCNKVLSGEVGLVVGGVVKGTTKQLHVHTARYIFWPGCIVRKTDGRLFNVLLCVVHAEMVPRMVPRMVVGILGLNSWGGGPLGLGGRRIGGG